MARHFAIAVPQGNGDGAVFACAIHVARVQIRNGERLVLELRIGGQRDNGVVHLQFGNGSELLHEWNLSQNIAPPAELLTGTKLFSCYLVLLAGAILEGMPCGDSAFSQSGNHELRVLESGDELVDVLTVRRTSVTDLVPVVTPLKFSSPVNEIGEVLLQLRVLHDAIVIAREQVSLVFGLSHRNRQAESHQVGFHQYCSGHFNSFRSGRIAIFQNGKSLITCARIARRLLGIVNPKGWSQKNARIRAKGLWPARKRRICAREKFARA